MNSREYLLDLNCLIALADPIHRFHSAMLRWYMAGGNADWGVCPLTESGFVRVTTNASYPDARTIVEAKAILADFAAASGYRYWPIEKTWAALTAPFAARIFGHQQVTDAYLLGLVVERGSVLVTFDKGIQYLAGAHYGKHVLLLG